MRAIGRLMAALALAATSPVAAQTVTPVPRIVAQNGRHALLVDGAPFLILGAQANNSSNYPAMLPRVWPTVARIGANTLAMPIAWQQIEPREGRFDFSFVQLLLDEARAHDKRLILLWFGTWKNTGPGYQPDWVKLDNRRFPRMKKRDGSDHYVHSPHARATLAADKRAFVALMTYLRDHDPQNTVVLVQPENETGSYGNPRDYSAEADRLFAQAIPPELARATGKRGTWAQAFGRQADRAFNSWHTARFVGEIAAAGKAVKPVPMYVNASLSDPFKDNDPASVASGGPQQDVLDIWKAAAPAIDFAAPDIYDRSSRNVFAYLDGFKRAGNALMVPEIGNAREYARFFWATLGRGGIGFVPFGMDDTDYANHPLGAAKLDEATLEAFAAKYRVFSGMAREWARIALERPTWGAARPDDGAPVKTVMGDWAITASFGEWQFGFKHWTWIKTEPPPWASEPAGGAIVAQLSPNEFLVTGDFVRLSFAARDGGPRAMMVRVEEGRFRDGTWVMDRVWNGDQTDYGLNLIYKPVWLKVTMGSYRN